eukprot:6267388-Pyramimonas_sp.AAC.1
MNVEGYKQMRASSEPTRFCGLCTVNHLFAADELSRGLIGGNLARGTARPARVIPGEPEHS